MLPLRAACRRRGLLNRIYRIDKGLDGFSDPCRAMLQLRKRACAVQGQDDVAWFPAILSSTVLLDPLAKRDYHWFKTVSERGGKPAPGWEGL
jgi:hypothetical protein